LDDFEVLFDGIPVEEINTSMTINATAMWLLALYVALAEQRGVDPAKLQGTTQNDIVKEYLARGTYIFPPRESVRLIVDMYEHCLHHVPRWNASNICSYHLQEAGATPTQELAFALATAMAVLDAVRARGGFSGDEFERCVGRVSFFVNSGIRFVEGMCKLRAFSEMWDEITRDRYGVQNPKHRLFRHGLQGDSPGRTREQPGDKRLAHPHRGARRPAQPQRPLPRAPASDLERGPQPAAPLGPAVVAAAPADPGLRDRPARVPRSVRWLARRGLEGGGTQGGRVRRD